MQPFYPSIYHTDFRCNQPVWLFKVLVRMRKGFLCFKGTGLVSFTLVGGLLFSEVGGLHPSSMGEKNADLNCHWGAGVLVVISYVLPGILVFYLAWFAQYMQMRKQSIQRSSVGKDDMRRSVSEEQELNELKSRFVAMVSHELRTPLTVIKTSTELLEHYSHATTEEKRHLYFQRIHKAIHNMTQLLEDVLTINKAEAGTLTFCPLLLDLNQFCRELVDEMQLDSSHPFVFLPQEDCHSVYFDPHLLRPTLTNVFSNAIKYSSKGEPIEVELSRQGQTAILKIRDYGIGIPQEDQPYLFKLFHRGKNVDTIQGTGLGLAIAKHCITLHQGNISFTSQVGQGTTFTLQIPLNLKVSQIQ